MALPVSEDDPLPLDRLTEGFPEKEVELARKLILWLVGGSGTPLGVFVPLLRLDLKKSSLEPKLKLGMVGILGSLKFESCQLSLMAFNRLLTCSEICSKRESSPREEAQDWLR